MKLAIVALTSGGLSGGMAKHLNVIARPLAEGAGEARLFAPEPLRATLASTGVELVTWPLGDRGVLSRELRAFAPDVVFIPTARWIDAAGVPVVVMVRNMEPLEVPFAGNSLREKVTNLGRRAVARYACRRATRVIAVSTHVRDFLASRWSVPESKIDVVYHGVDEPRGETRPASLQAIGSGRFLFTAGSIRPARGLEDAIGALANDGGGLPLVIAGKVDPGAERYARKLDALARSLGVEQRVIRAGQLNAAEMSWCFRNAALFVMTSRAEACPNTVLEAMRHGALAVSGDNAPMPEFFGTSAIYYRPGDATSLASAIRAALAAPEDRRAALRDEALRRAAQFTWQRTAEQTLAVLRKAAA